MIGLGGIAIVSIREGHVLVAREGKDCTTAGPQLFDLEVLLFSAPRRFGGRVQGDAALSVDEKVRSKVTPRVWDSNLFGTQ